MISCNLSFKGIKYKFCHKKWLSHPPIRRILPRKNRKFQQIPKLLLTVTYLEIQPETQKFPWRLSQKINEAKHRLIGLVCKRMSFQLCKILIETTALQNYMKPNISKIQTLLSNELPFKIITFKKFAKMLERQSHICIKRVYIWMCSDFNIFFFFQQTI